MPSSKGGLVNVDSLGLRIRSTSFMEGGRGERRSRRVKHYNPAIKLRWQRQEEEEEEEGEKWECGRGENCTHSEQVISNHCPQSVLRAESWWMKE